ncbi:MAG: glycosyltransferase family 2 protein [Candidatus Pacebacteria bacterium]|nr:glycosyltransferase family 2 protein [Candidatus Paceibacterota bacterium]
MEKKNKGMNKMKLSIIIPVFNEEKTLKEVINKIEMVNLIGNLEREIVLVEDASRDLTGKIMEEYEKKEGFKVIRHKENKGKGASVTDGIKAASGDFLIIQDADLEYDPDDYNKILPMLLNGEAEVVYGSRFLKEESIKKMTWKQYFSNKILTIFSNFLTGLKLTDMETCYKAFTKKVADEIKNKLISERFGIEPEITARVKKFEIKEVPISYKGRSYGEGKKIGWKDGFSAIWQIIKFNIFKK